MTRDQFLRSRRPDWKRFESLVLKAETHRVPKLEGAELSQFSALYRALCFDLSLIQSRDWGASLGGYLNNLVTRGHNCFYRSRPGSWRAALTFIHSGFPRLLRANASYFMLALALLVVPGLISGLAVAQNPDLAARILPPEMQEQLELMYSGDLERPSGSENMMAGFYIKNNVGISFQCFALGMLAGIGTIVVLLYNSIFLGAVSGFMVATGHSERFFSFVIGHGSFELTAIVVSGAAGLVLGRAVVHPGALSWGESLRTRGLVAVQLALGAAVMLLIAAGLEAYWSSQELPAAVKLTVGTVLWIGVIAWLTLGGRVHEA